MNLSNDQVILNQKRHPRKAGSVFDFCGAGGIFRSHRQSTGPLKKEVRTLLPGSQTASSIKK